MGQAEIIKFLEKNKKIKYSTVEISNAIKSSRSCTTVCCKKLRDAGEVKYEYVSNVLGSCNQMTHSYQYWVD